MNQLPLCVGIVCVTAIIITMIICKVSLETIFGLTIGLIIIAFAVAVNGPVEPEDYAEEMLLN